MAREVRLGMGKGAVYPASKAKMLLHPARRFLHSPTRLAEQLQLSRDMSVLELGPGPGYFSIEMAKRLPEGRLVLFDIQAEMLEMARERLAGAGLSMAAPLQGDALALPFREGTFDVAVLVAMLGEVPSPEQCLGQVFRVLKPGGVLVVSEARGDPDRIAYSRLKEMAEAIGFVPPAGNPGRGWTYTARFSKPH